MAERMTLVNEGETEVGSVDLQSAYSCSRLSGVCFLIICRIIWSCSFVFFISLASSSSITQLLLVSFTKSLPIPVRLHLIWIEIPRGRQHLLHESPLYVIFFLDISGQLPYLQVDLIVGISKKKQNRLKVRAIMEGQCFLSCRKIYPIEENNS